MTQEARPAVQAPTPVGSNVPLMRLLFQNPAMGFFFLLAVIVEAMLFLMFILGRTPVERFVTLGTFLVLVVILLVAFSIERKRWWEAQNKPAFPSAAPVIVTDPIEPHEVERRSDLVTAPDGTFVYAPPPANWRVEFRSGQEELRLAYERAGTGAPPPGAELRAFRQGTIVVFREIDTHRLAFLPGKSLINGRPAIASGNEDHSDQVGMYSVNKRGGVMRDMPVEHVFAHVLGGLVMAAGVKVETIRVAPSDHDGRATLTACCSNRLRHVLIDGSEVDSAAVETRLHVFDYINFVYVVQTSYLTGAPESDARQAEIDRIIASFRAASAANPAERDQADVREADAAYDQLAKTYLPDILLLKAKVLRDQMRTPSGSARVSERQLEDLRLLAAYAKEFPHYLADDVRASLIEFLTAAEEAHDGQLTPLLELIRLDEQLAQQDAMVASEPQALPGK